MQRLKKFLEKLFQLNLGPVGWLSFDTSLVRTCLEEAVLVFLEQLEGKLSLHDAARSLNLVVPVLSGLAHRALEDTSLLPHAVLKHSALLCAYAVARPALLRGDLGFLVNGGEGGALLTLEAKRAWLTCEKERLMRLGKASITIVTGRTGIMHDICQTLTPPGSGAAVGISVAFRDERAAGDGLRREWFQLVVSASLHAAARNLARVLSRALRTPRQRFKCAALTDGVTPAHVPGLTPRARSLRTRK